MHVDMLHIGAREHYVVPKMLHEQGVLRTLYTDAYAGRGSNLYWARPLLGALGKIDATLGNLLQRTSDLPPEKIAAFNLLGIKAKMALNRCDSVWDRMHAFHAFQDELSRRVIRAVKTPPEVMMSFRGASVLFEHFSGKSRCVLDQIDGGIHEVIVVQEEQRRNLGWLPKKPDWLICEETGETYWLDVESEWLQREWMNADLIVCNSKWSRKCLIQSGVTEDKIRIIPLSFELPQHSTTLSRRTRKAGSTLAVAFLGTVGLRKGVHHLMEAARLANRTVPVRLYLAGSCQIRKEKIAGYGDIVDYKGQIPRNAVPEYLQQCDILALPSVSEGFGIVQLEAMSLGLPVISSDRTGDVVIDGVNGIRVSAGDVEGLAAALVRLSENPDEYDAMSMAAMSRAKDFSREKVAKQWVKVIENAQ